MIFKKKKLCELSNIIFSLGAKMVCFNSLCLAHCPVKTDVGLSALNYFNILKWEKLWFTNLEFCY